MPSANAAQSVVLRVAGPEEVVAPVETFHCGGQAQDDRDYPDSAVHAYRAADGTIRIFAINQSNFPLIADASLSHFSQPSCTPMLSSPLKDDPALFADRIWLNAPYTLDGTHVVAITHIEYHGLLHAPYGNACKAKGDSGRSGQTCWYSATGLATSSDGGSTFSQSGLVAALPYKFDASMVRAGVSNASNILRNPHDGHYYVFVRAFGYGVQATGECLLQSSDLQHWRAWDGKGFSIGFVNPYGADASPAAAHVCTSVFKPSVFFTVVYSTPLNLFLAISRDDKNGFHCVTSPDLIHWSPEALSVQTAFFSGFYPGTWSPNGNHAALYASQWPTGENLPAMYPSLIDPQSTDRNFGTIGEHPYLFFVRVRTRIGPNGIAVPDNPSREIVRVPLHVEKS